MVMPATIANAILSLAARKAILSVRTAILMLEHRERRSLVLERQERRSLVLEHQER